MHGLQWHWFCVGLVKWSARFIQMINEQKQRKKNLQNPNFINVVLTDIQSFPQRSELYCVGVSSSTDCSAWGKAWSRLVEIWIKKKEKLQSSQCCPLNCKKAWKINFKRIWTCRAVETLLHFPQPTELLCGNITKTQKDTTEQDFKPSFKHFVTQNMSSTLNTD